MLVRVSCVVKRSVLLSIRIASSLVLISLREGSPCPPRILPSFACMAGEHLRGFSLLILIF